MDFGVARLNQSEQLTRDFGSKGRVVVPFKLGGKNYDGGWLSKNSYETRVVGRVQLVIDSKSRILVSGPFQTGQDEYDYGVCCLTSGGKLDKTFGLNSRVVVAFNQAGAGVDQPLDVTRDRQDRVILVGSVQATVADEEGFWRDRVGVTRLAVNGRRPRTTNARA